VAEAGRGGDECQTVPAPGGETVRICVGETSQITRIDLRSGEQRRVGRRFPSLVTDPNELGEATGAHDVSFGGGTR